MLPMNNSVLLSDIIVKEGRKEREGRVREGERKGRKGGGREGRRNMTVTTRRGDLVQLLQN